MIAMLKFGSHAQTVTSFAETALEVIMPVEARTSPAIIERVVRLVKFKVFLSKKCLTSPYLLPHAVSDLFFCGAPSI